MHTIHIRMQETGNDVTMTTSTVLAGTQYDHLEAKLVFERPAAYAGDCLLLYLNDRYGQSFAPINLSTGNTLPLTGTLTQTTALHVQAAFVRNNQEVLRTNVLVLRLRDAHAAQSGTNPQWPDPLTVLMAGALCRVETAGDTLHLFNMANELVSTIAAPRGADGKDGLTTSVNGVVQVDGNVTLTASDINAGGASVQDTLESLIASNAAKLPLTGGTMEGALGFSSTAFAKETCTNLGLGVPLLTHKLNVNDTINIPANRYKAFVLSLDTDDTLLFGAIHTASMCEFSGTRAYVASYSLRHMWVRFSISGDTWTCTDIALVDQIADGTLTFHTTVAKVRGLYGIV